jgi:LmbE family N-acetylglucosaminyl deacetylase
MINRPSRSFTAGFSAITAILFMTGLSACTGNRPDYRLISTYQDYTVPEYKTGAHDSPRVLVIVPHADDETIAGGLIAMLKDHGAVIHLLTLCEPGEERAMELDCSAAALGIEKVETAGFINNTWDDIMQDRIAFWYDNQDSIRSVIRGKINSFRPEILITYDSEIGGYGHPEHRISATLAEQLLMEYSGDSTFSPQTIFQITLSDGLEKFLVARSPGYDLQKRLTCSDGLPAPDVAVDIRKYWPAKNSAARCHRSQIDILKRFYIVYDEKDEAEHMEAFSREYYRVISR